MYSANNSWILPAEEVTLATIDSWGGQQGEAVWVTVPGAWSGEPHRPLTTCRRTPADGWVVLHKGLEQREEEMMGVKEMTWMNDKGY